ncbi:MAG: hypothetical protein DRN55_03180 [Thermoplasmata archaeon]|nr:MAG: hypothetical protein DRN55_03180 [Thermoplasmata archaeon]
MSAEVSDETLEVNPRKSLKRVLKHLRDVLKKIKEMDRHLNLSRIAWMEMRGELSHPQLQPFKEELFKFLKRAADFEKRYFLLERNIRRGFDRYMKSKGLSRVSTPEYKSLKNAIAEAVITRDGRVWAYSFDTYLPVLSSYSPPPGLDGKRAFEEISSSFAEEVDSLYGEAGELLKWGRTILKRARAWQKEGLKSPWEKVSPGEVEEPKVGRKKRRIIRMEDYLTTMNRMARKRPLKALILRRGGR